MSHAHAAGGLGLRRHWLRGFLCGSDCSVVRRDLLGVEGRQAAAAAEFLHGSFTIWNQDDVLRPEYHPAENEEVIRFNIKDMQLVK